MQSANWIAIPLVLGVLNSGESAASSRRLPVGYSERVVFPLTRGRDGLDGRLELLEDARIHPAMREAIRQAWGGDPCAERPQRVLDALCSTLDHAHLRPALLRLLASDGHVVAERTAERPLAELSAVQLYDSSPMERRTYSYSVDLSADAGSYSGPYTILAEPTPRGFGWLLSTDSLGAHPNLIWLVSTLKSGWRAASRPDGGGKDILMVRCRPDLHAGSPNDAPSFLLTFERFSFDGAHWVRHVRTEPGCWEDDDSTSFPARSRFP